MKIRFLEIAQIELDEAVEFYRSRGGGYDKETSYQISARR